MADKYIIKYTCTWIQCNYFCHWTWGCHWL